MLMPEDVNELNHIQNMLAQTQISLNQISNERLSEVQLNTKKHATKSIKDLFELIKYFPLM